MRKTLIAAGLTLLLVLPAAADKPAWQKQIEQVLEQKRVTLDFTDTPLGDVLDFLRQISGTDIVLDPRARAEQLKVTLRVKDLKLGAALDLMLAMHKLARGPRCGVLVVGTPALLAAFPADGPPAPPAEGGDPQERAAWTRLQRTVMLDFIAHPLSVVLQFLREVSGENMVLEPALARRNPKVTLRVRHIPMLQVMTLLATICKGEIARKNGVWILRDKPQPRACGPCGKALAAGWKFCPWCGKAAEQK